MVDDEFPERYARSRRFTLGAPRDPAVAPAGNRVLFLRSRAGDDPLTCLWALDVDSGVERLVADPAVLAGIDGRADVPVEERRRRERVRESAGGVVAYTTDRACTVAAFALGGRLFVAPLDDPRAEVRELAVTGPVVDPRPDPTGRRVAAVCAGALWVWGIDGSGGRALAEPDGPQVTHGLAEFVAAEEMGRRRGFWWSPDGEHLLVARVDETPVQRWFIADPANPAAVPRSIAYPAAGTANADVRRAVLGLDGSRVAVEWDRVAFEYLVSAGWDGARPLVAVQSRDQRTVRVLEVDPATGVTAVRREDHDESWLTIVAGVPAVTDRGELVWTADSEDTRRLLVDGVSVTPPGLQVRAVGDVDGGEVLFTASAEPTEIHVWSWTTAAGVVRVTSEPGVHDARQAGGTRVVSSWTWDGAAVTVQRAGRADHTVPSAAWTPGHVPRVLLTRGGRQELRTAVLLPSWHRPGAGSLPVLMDPYGGPAGQKVLAARDVYDVSRWFADQGFAVVVADGRGTPGRGPAWERSIHLDVAGPALEDQVTALHAVAAAHPDLDLARVGIRGWSYGGYLAALAVLRRPDVFHAAVAGAPPTDHRLYDTHVKERYLGHPDEHPEAYDRCSLIPDAARLERPLMLVHGLADDNVVVANTLRLSTALLAAGRPHTVLPLSGTTHLATLPGVLRLELEFFQRVLGQRQV